MSDNKRKWKLFDSQREGKGVSKDEATLGPGLKKFWRIYRENFFGRLLYLNILMIVGNFPLIFVLMAYLGVGKVAYTVPGGNLFSLMHGIVSNVGGYTPSSLAMLGVAGMQNVTAAATPWTYVLYGLGSLSLLTWGFVSAGSAYVLRNMSTDRPIFMLSDFFDTYRKNWKQVLPFGMIDLAITIILPFNIISMLRSGGSGVLGFFFWVSVVLFLIWFVMRWYAYLQIVSFRLSLWKIIKNSLYFVLLGIKRNLVALLGIALILGTMAVLLFAFGNYLIALVLAIPLLMLFSTAGLMANYAAWYKIDEIMVIHEQDPDHTEPSDTSDDPDATSETP